MVCAPKRCRPADGWTCREVYDAKLADPSGEVHCEICGTRLRWVHVVEHEEYYRSVEVGCCCAVRLCFDYDAAAAERELRGRHNRRVRFLDRSRWKPSKHKPRNIWRRVWLPDKAQVTVTIFIKDCRFCIYIAGEKDDRWCDGEAFITQDKALDRAFELVETLRGG